MSTPLWHLYAIRLKMAAKLRELRGEPVRESGTAEVVDFAAYRASNVIDLMDHPSGRDHEPDRHGSPPPLPRRRRKSFLRDQDGTVIIEAAIILPVWLFAIAMSIDAGLAVVARFELQMGTAQAAIALAAGNDPQSVFSGNSAGTVACTSETTTATCTGSLSYPTVFAGVLGLSAFDLQAHAVAAKGAKS